MSFDEALLNLERRLNALGETTTAEQFAARRQGWGRADLKVLVFGEFNRGKSTLINALLGRIVLPAKLIPTTGHVTRLVAATDREEVVVQHLDGREERCPLAQLDSFSSLDVDGTARGDVATITVHVQSETLRHGLTLIDAPGVGEQERQTRRALDAVGEADVVLLVLDARQLLGARERELAGAWMTHELGKPIAPVLNFMGMIDPLDQGEVRRIVDRWASQVRSPFERSWFEVDALAAIKHAIDAGPPPRDDFFALRQALTSFDREGRRSLQRASRRAQLLADVQSANRRNEALIEQLEADSSRVNTARREEREGLESLARRFDSEVDFKRGALAVAARLRFESCFQSLADDYLAGKSKRDLEERAPRWYSDAMTLAARQAEKEGEAALFDLTFDRLPRPEPLTVVEQVTLRARFHVVEKRSEKGLAAWTTGGVVVGGALGSVLLPIPGLGYVMGAAAGAALARWLGRSEPDHGAAYRDAIEPHWNAEAERISRVLLAEFDARIRELKDALAARLRAAVPLAPQELDERLKLRQALDECRVLCESLE